MQEISDQLLGRITDLVRIDGNNEPFVDVASLASAAGLEHDEVAQYAHLTNAVDHGAKKVDMLLDKDEVTPFQMSHSFYLSSNSIIHMAKVLQPCVLRVLLFMVYGYMQSYTTKINK